MTDAPGATAPRRSRLRLRRPADIALAFVLAPTAGLTVLWVLMLAGGVLFFPAGFAHIARLSLAFFYIYLLIFGGLVCLVVELVVVTPLLVGFHRYRWRWLNGWTGALIGFVLAFLPTLLVVALAPSRGGHGARPGWIATTFACAVVGLVGVSAAGVFRLLGVRTVREGEP
jgi:hypothetical protein